MFTLRRSNETTTPPPPSTLFSSTNGAGARRAKAWLEDRLKRGRNEAFSEIVELNPALAEMLLDMNPDNRPKYPTNVRDIVKNIVSGDYELNGETVIVSMEGYLNDGMHRCLGVVEAGRPIKTFIAFGVDRESRKTVDQGRVRTSGDYLAMSGVPDANHAACVAGWLWQYRQFGRVTRNQEYRPTKIQVQQSYRDHPGIDDSIRAVPQRGMNLAGGKSILAFCHWLFARRDEAAATNFINKLVRGDNLGLTDPIYVCRERLHTDARERHQRLRTDEKIEMIFHAWNTHRRGGRSKVIKITGTLPTLSN